MLYVVEICNSVGWRYLSVPHPILDTIAVGRSQLLIEIDILNAWNKRLTTAEIGREPIKPRLYHYSPWIDYKS